MKVLRRVFDIAIAIVALISLSVAFAIPAKAMHKLSYIKEKSGYYILYDTILKNIFKLIMYNFTFFFYFY